MEAGAVRAGAAVDGRGFGVAGEAAEAPVAALMASISCLVASVGAGFASVGAGFDFFNFVLASSAIRCVALSGYFVTMVS